MTIISFHRPTGYLRIRAGFSLVELVLVIAIIAIVAGIAVTRYTSGSGAAEANALAKTLQNVRNAIERFYAEHQKYPGFNPSNGSPNGTWFVDQLTQYSDIEGNVSRTPSPTFLYGPYLREPFPANPANGLSTVRVRANSGINVPFDSTGWVANLDDGKFNINTSSNGLIAIGVTIDGGEIKALGKGL